jgi:hypothetical protein
MAIVRNIANEVVARDKSYCVTNRRGAGSPQGTLTPQYVGEIYQDTSAGGIWYASGLTNNDWVYSEGTTVIG